jgi:hypothetical protein
MAIASLSRVEIGPLRYVVGTIEVEAKATAAAATLVASYFSFSSCIRNVGDEYWSI